METNTESGRVDLEFEAMRHVLQALSALPDDAARARVLRWVGDRLTLPQPAVQPQGADPAGARAERPKPIEVIDTSDLNLEGLESLFDGEPSGENQGEDTVGAASSSSSSPSPRGEVKGFHRRSRSRHSA